MTTCGTCGGVVGPDFWTGTTCACVSKTTRHGAALHEALLAGWPFCWVEGRQEVISYRWDHFGDPRPRSDSFRGFDPNRDMPHDPDGLDDIDPFVLGLTAGRSAKTLLILATSAYHAPPDSWIRDLYGRCSVLTESPPCQMMAEAPEVVDAGKTLFDGGFLTWGGDLAPSELLREGIRAFDEPPRCPYCRVNTLLYGCFCDTGANSTYPCGPGYDAISGDYVLEMKSGPLTMDELRFLRDPIERTPAPTGKRYGPYDADPHTKGRRRRFRPQRKA